MLKIDLITRKIQENKKKSGFFIFSFSLVFFSTRVALRFCKSKNLRLVYVGFEHSTTETVK